MIEEHWLDALGKMLAHGSSRRNLLGTAAALSVGMILGGTTEDGAAADPCNTFPKRKDRDFCRVKRNRCKRAGTSFCIVTNPDNPPKRATCCHHGGVCCNGDCCGPWRYGDESIPGKCCDGECCPGLYACCPANPSGKDRCCAAHEGETCCPDSPSGCCPPGRTCCPGVGCVDIENDPNHCGGCGRSCGAGEQCVDHGCRSGGGGGCRDADCPPGQRCHDGACGCADGYKYCPDATRCVEERFTCCGGLPVGDCVVGMVCCGSGVGAYCIHPGNPCTPRNGG